MHNTIGPFCLASCIAYIGALPVAAAANCVREEQVSYLAQCMNQADQSPRSCLEQAPWYKAAMGEICDQDQDGLDDQFEDALARSYTPVFAFNQNLRAEINWPGNIDHFIRNSLLLYSPTGLKATEPESWSGRKIVRETLIADDLKDVAYAFDGKLYRGNDPGKEHGSNFWLCQKKAFDTEKYGGPLSPQEKLTNSTLSAAVPGGIGIYTIVHPSNWDRSDHSSAVTPSQDQWSRYVLIAFELFFPYNEHTADNHEGDWEGVGVFVDTESATGAVIGAYFQRHNSTEHEQLIMAANSAPDLDQTNVIKPGSTRPQNSHETTSTLQFFDHVDARHRIIAYVASGDHAMYHHAGETRLIAIPWPGDPLWLTDLHFGDGLKLVPWRNRFVQEWDDPTGIPIRDGIQIINLGEEHRPRVDWASFRGQWGCQNGLAGKLNASWPNPFGNERHCRGWLRHNWGSELPFNSPEQTPDCSGM